MRKNLADMQSGKDLTPVSSHKHYLKSQDGQIKDRGTWLYTRLGLSFFSAKRKEAIKHYRQFLKDGIDPHIKAFYKRKHQNPILGDQSFIDHIKEKYVFSDSLLTSEIPQERQINAALKARNIVQQTAREFSKSKDSIYQSKRGELNTPRHTAIMLTRELSGLRLSEIADHFKIKSYRTVASSIFRCKKLLAKDPHLRRRCARIWRICSQEKT